MMKYILLTIFVSVFSAEAMDEQQLQKSQDSSAPKQSYVIDYEELYAQGIPDKEVSKIHGVENQRLMQIMDSLRAALKMLKRPVESEIYNLISQALSKVQEEEDDDMHRWSEAFTKHAPQVSFTPSVDPSSAIITESPSKDISQ